MTTNCSRTSSTSSSQHKLVSSPVIQQEHYSSTQVTLGKGDRLLLYTDGLSEARDHHDREYGDDRLPALLGECHQLPAVALVSRLLEDVSEFSSARPRSDDLTVMAIEMVGH